MDGFVFDVFVGNLGRYKTLYKSFRNNIKSLKPNKFPHLIKIRNGKLIDKSINNAFYSVLNMNKSRTELLNKINMFFELNKIKNDHKTV